MAKTIEALKKADEERRHQMGEFIPPRKIVDLKWTPQSEIENQRLRQNLLRLIPERNIRAILFASCNEGEGASTVIIHFASALASGGEKVLLVDANLRTPSLHAALNVGRDNGFTDLMLGRSTLARVIKETKLPNLSVISSGTPHSGPVSLLESDSLEAYVAGMKERAQWILFDAPPLSRFMDAVVLGSRVDGIVMVVEAEKTRWEVAEVSRQRIIQGNGNVLGAVLNKRRYPVPDWFYKRM
jgi:capsular exopolysaccharide synthesis family protein